MNNQTPQTLKGFRDFLPEEKRRRQFVASKMSTVFERFGFAPLETPTLEYAELLTGKYGEEADKLLYTFTDRGERKIGLRYDQTVPTARILAQYQNELPKYFRRYQIQNVFRADKPQKGRFREFTQCDCDIYGTTSAIADAEILAVLYAVYKELGFGQVSLLINDRKLLAEQVSSYEKPEITFASIMQSIDKLDKLPGTEVANELMNKGMDLGDAMILLNQLTLAKKSNNLVEIEQNAISLGVPKEALKFTPTLARGLDYYTGLIVEVQLPEYKAGSVAGGGRYDNLIEQLGGIAIPAVGFGIGFDRTVEAADALGLIPTSLTQSEVLITLFDNTTVSASLQAAAMLRSAGIAVDVYPALDKLNKQFKYADQLGIPFALVIGPDELQTNKIVLKNMKSGTQSHLTLSEGISLLKNT